jgi:hypothetical protein
MVVNIKMVLEKGCEGMDWIDVAQDKEDWWAFSPSVSSFLSSFYQCQRSVGPARQLQNPLYCAKANISMNYCLFLCHQQYYDCLKWSLGRISGGIVLISIK